MEVHTLSEKESTNLEALKEKIYDDMKLSDQEKAWLDDPCFLRYLRARDLDVSKAETMLKESLEWRRQMKPHEIKTEDVKNVMDMATMYMSGHDKEHRPIIYMKPGATNPYPSEERVKYLVYMLETAISTMDAKDGVEKMTWLLDFGEYKRAADAESKQTSKTSMHILQNHYPERLGLAVIINSPWYFSWLFTIISPFLHANTKKKIKWVSGTKEDIYRVLKEYIDDDQLEEHYGGTKPNPVKNEKVDLE
eukprot:TRINITY_DN6803_c0_g1_i1.p1 TRINITY_DN6803_c0_g1~~TRINITY_DN6803_c0_g1_i1.p1  ORF type:complete len:250 (-),score=74.53 TRINITY_DN6803_c0_g1_i1:10-759(-)